jgi:hypothetical protein
MEPIIFPYTYLTESRYRLYQALFGPLTLLQAAANQIPEHLTSLAVEGGLVIRTPVTERAEELAACRADFAAWAEQQQGAGKRKRTGLDSQFFRHHGRQVPFYEDTAVTRLKSAIRSGGESTPENPPEAIESDRLFQARLFLSMAQEYDRHQWDLVDDLWAFETQEQRLMDNLQGGPPAPYSPPPTVDSPDDYQVGARVRAWWRLWQADTEPRETPALLITSSGQVLEEMKELGIPLSRFARLEDVSGQLAAQEVLRLVLMDWLALLATREGDPLDKLPPPVEFKDCPGQQSAELEVFIASNHPWSALDRHGNQSMSAHGKPGSHQYAQARHGVLILVNEPNARNTQSMGR